MPKSNNRYDVEESGTSQPAPVAGLPRGIASEIFTQPGAVNLVKPRGPDRNQLQAENEELKEKLQQVQDMLNQRPSNGLNVQTSTIAVGDSLLTPTGLHVPEDFNYEDWEQLGHLIFRLEGAIQWLIGDWLVYGADLQYGDVKQIADVMGRDVNTFYNLMTTCRGVESSRRREVLSFAHHYEVRGLTPDNQVKALGFAEQARFNVKQFRRWIKLGMPETGLPDEATPALPAGNQSSHKTVISQFDKFFDRDPSKAKPQEREQAVSIYQQMTHTLSEYRRKWSIDG